MEQSSHTGHKGLMPYVLAVEGCGTGVARVRHDEQEDLLLPFTLKPRGAVNGRKAVGTNPAGKYIHSSTCTS